MSSWRCQVHNPIRAHETDALGEALQAFQREGLRLEIADQSLNHVESSAD